jgi:Tfp pilus assembly protein PilV
VSLVELIVATLIFALTLLGLAAAGTIAARHLYTSRSDVQHWAAAQQQIEELARQGIDRIRSDSSVVQGYRMRWTVTGTNPKKTIFTVELTNQSGRVVQDTIVLYFAKPD